MTHKRHLSLKVARTPLQLTFDKLINKWNKQLSPSTKHEIEKQTNAWNNFINSKNWDKESDDLLFSSLKFIDCAPNFYILNFLIKRFENDAKLQRCFQNMVIQRQLGDTQFYIDMLNVAAVNNYEIAYIDYLYQSEKMHQQLAEKEKKQNKELVFAYIRALMHHGQLERALKICKVYNDLNTEILIKLLQVARCVKHVSTIYEAAVANHFSNTDFYHVYLDVLMNFKLETTKAFAESQMSLPIKEIPQIGCEINLTDFTYASTYLTLLKFMTTNPPSDPIIVVMESDTNNNNDQNKAAVNKAIRRVVAEKHLKYTEKSALKPLHFYKVKQNPNLTTVESMPPTNDDSPGSNPFDFGSPFALHPPIAPAQEEKSHLTEGSDMSPSLTNKN